MGKSKRQPSRIRKKVLLIHIELEPEDLFPASGIVIDEGDLDLSVTTLVQTLANQIRQRFDRDASTYFKQNYGKKFKKIYIITTDPMYDNGYGVDIVGERLETDAEYKKRCQQLGKKKEDQGRQEAHERKLYEKLKKKFERN